MMREEKGQLTPDIRAQIDAILAASGYDGSKLVGILLDIQDIIPMHYIPEEVAYYLAEKLDVKVTNIYDVISFYASLYEQPRGKYPIQMCESIVCGVNDNGLVFDTLKELLGIGINEATADGKYYLECVPCFGACDIAPAVRVNGKVYGHLNSREKIEAMLAELV